MSAAAWVEELTTSAGLQRAVATRAPGIVAGLCAIGIAVQAVMVLTFEPGGPAPVIRRVAGGTGQPAAPPVNLQAIVDAHLFGVAGLRPGSAQDAPQTSLPLVLAGILANTDASKGAAIIGSTSANAKLVNVGGTVEGGARVHAVYPDRVVLERGGALESLFLPRNYAMTPSLIAPTQTGTGPTPMQRLQSAAGSGALFNRLARVTPVTAQNRLLGYRIFPIGGTNSQQAFARLGLVSGDLLVAVNGTPLDDPAKSNAVLQTLASAASASVTVQRNGAPLELNLNLETLAATAEAAIQADQEAAVAASRGDTAAGTPPRPAFGPGSFGRARRGATSNDGNSGGASRDGGSTQ